MAKQRFNCFYTILEFNLFVFQHLNFIFLKLFYCRSHFPNLCATPFASINSHRLSENLKRAEEENSDAMFVFVSDVWLDQLKVGFDLIIVCIIGHVLIMIA